MRTFPAKNGWQDALQKLREENGGLKKQIATLQEDLKLNSSMLAKQTDLAREAETKLACWENEHYAKSYRELEAENERLREALGEPICPECQGIGTFSQEGCRQGEYICVKCGFVKQEALRGGGKKTAQIGDAYNDEIAREIWISYDDKEAKG